MTALKRWPSFDQARPVRPWLLGIASKVMGDAQKKRRRAKELVAIEPHELVDDRGGGDTLLMKRDAQSLVEQALKSLEPNKRAVFMMYEPRRRTGG